MKFEQVFGDYKVLVNIPNDTEISVINVESKVVWLHVKNDTVSWCRRFSTHIKIASHQADIYQEALALANTKNLTPELLVELGYKQV